MSGRTNHTPEARNTGKKILCAHLHLTGSRGSQSVGNQVYFSVAYRHRPRLEVGYPPNIMEDGDEDDDDGDGAQRSYRDRPSSELYEFLLGDVDASTASNIFSRSHKPKWLGRGDDFNIIEAGSQTFLHPFPPHSLFSS